MTYNQSQQQILNILRNQPSSPSDLVSVMGKSRQMIHIYLKELIQEGYIVKHGAGSRVTYSIAEQNGNTKNSRVKESYDYFKKDFSVYKKKYANRITHLYKKIQREEVHINEEIFLFMLEKAAVASSQIEGNSLDLNSYLNSKSLATIHKPKEAQEIVDLVSAYEYASQSHMTEKNMLRAHKMASKKFVNKTRQGVYRQEPVGVFSQKGLEYLAIEPDLVSGEMKELFVYIKKINTANISFVEALYWASWIHLMFVLIHPFSDGNGRVARLLEKWFIAESIGESAFNLQTENYYMDNRSTYYNSLRMGVNYWETDFTAAEKFFSLLPKVFVDEV